MSAGDAGGPVMDAIKKIEAALAAGPSGNEWEQHSLMVSEAGEVVGRGRDICHCGIGMRKETGEAVRNAAFIAACNPAAIREVLQTLASNAADVERLREVLKVVQGVLIKTNELPRGPIVDTIWYSDHETLFDYIDAALTNQQPTTE